MITSKNTINVNSLRISLFQRSYVQSITMRLISINYMIKINVNILYYIIKNKYNMPPIFLNFKSNISKCVKIKLKKYILFIN